MARPPQPIDPPLPRFDEFRAPPSLALRAAWAASVLALGGLFLGLWLFRAEVAAAWPPAERLLHLVEAVAAG